jgi:ribose transport system substrate-binding protein
MKNIRLCFVILLGLTIVPITACGNGHSGETYMLISNNIKVPYWQIAAGGWLQSANQLKVGYEFTGPATYDPASEKTALEYAIQKRPAGILVSVADANLLGDVINRGIAEGIPIVTVDSDAPSSKRLFFIGTNNYAAGVAGGKRLAQELKGHGTVAVFTMPSQPNLQERLHGYRDALESSPGIKLAEIKDIKGDSRVAFDTTTQILANDKKEHIDAFVCLEALSCKEVATVLSNNSITGRPVIGMDTDPETLDWIKKGVIVATIAQKPFTMAFVGLKMLDNLHHQQLQTLDRDWAHDGFAPVPAFVDTGSAIVDKSNVESFESATKSLTGK